MVAYVVSNVVVFDQRLYTGSGLVGRWMRGVERTFTIRAIAAAPLNKRPNTGHGAPGGLKAGIHGSTARVGVRQVEATVTSTAYYTKWVLGGTTGPIYSRKGYRYSHGLDRRLSGPFKVTPRKTKGDRVQGRKGYFMRLPVNPRFGGTSAYHYAVSGQRANNFMIAAYNSTARRHRALQPIAPAFIFRH